MKGLLKKILLLSIIGVNSILAQPNLMSLVKNNSESIKNLNYYKSKEFSIDFPNDRKLVFDLGTSGHGDIFEPFMGIKSTIKVVDIQTSNDKAFNAKNAAKKVFRIIAKKQIQSLIGENIDDFMKNLPPIAKWIVEKVLQKGDLSPVEEFIFRTYILYKSDLGRNSDELKRAEFVALLFKLAITQGQNVLDIQENLTEYIFKNETLNEILGPKFINLIIDTIKYIQSNTMAIESDVKPKLESKVKAGYLFKDKEQAEQCYRLFAKDEEYSQKDFKNIVENYIKGLAFQSQDIWVSRTGFEIVPVDQFLEYKNSSFGNFVGFEFEFDSHFLPENLNIDSDIVLYSNEDGNWILFNGNKTSFEIKNEVKLILRAFYRAFDNYRRINKADPLHIEKTFNLTTEKKEELKDILDDLLRSQKNIENQIKVLDKEIKNLEAKENSTWRKFFSMNIEERLNSFKQEKQEKEESLSLINLKIKKLNFYLYSFNDPKHLEKLKRKGTLSIIVDIFLSNPRFVQIIENINTNQRYAFIKENLIKDLSEIFSRSDLIKKNAEITEYFLSGLFPEYKEYFQDFTKNLNQQNNDDTANLLLSFVGL